MQTRHPSWRYKAILLVTFSVCLWLPVTAQTQQSNTAATPAPKGPPCSSSPEYRQFDFWVGEWDVLVNGTTQQAGTNDVQLILGKCVLLENWTGARGGTGKSFNIYNAARGQWQQTWVDNGGNVLELYGSFKDGAMRLEGEKPGPNGSKIINRISFFPMEGGRVRQLWESSTDNGKTWTVAFDGLYVRKKTAEAK